MFLPSNINPRKLKKLLKDLDLTNLKLQEVPSVEKVEIYLRDGTKLVVSNPVVTKLNIAGMTIFQIQTSEQNIRQEKIEVVTTRTQSVDIFLQQPSQQVQVSTQETKPLFTDEDVELVMQETGCSREEAIKALEETKGDIAEAIMLIKSRKSGS